MTERLLVWIGPLSLSSTSTTDFGLAPRLRVEEMIEYRDLPGLSRRWQTQVHARHQARQESLPPKSEEVFGEIANHLWRNRRQ